MPPPIRLKSMQNSTFLVLLNKNSHPNGLGSRSCEGLAVFWTWEVDFFFLERTQSWSAEATEFWWRPFFWTSPNFGWNNRFNFGDDLFFGGGGRSPDFNKKTASICFKTNENLGQVRLLLFSPLKKAPLFAKSWLRACQLQLQLLTSK